ncbi:MAG TPA: hypothetical protein IGS52_18550 [Oscillatoriaceae cyanobacterium M33_DOE_052]|nr:hypothetical protein [Oscillatoriaceae cyanobacterium M33_DOE_052]
MFYYRRLIPLIALLSLTAAGCQFLPQAGNKEAQTESGASDQEATPNKLPPEQIYDKQVNQDEVWGLVKKIGFTDNSIVVTLEVTNGSKQVIELNAKDDMYLMDNTGDSRYNLVPPPNNRTLPIQPGTTLKGDFVFTGRLSPRANELTLYINSSSSRSDSQTPYITFDEMFIRR